MIIKIAVSFSCNVVGADQSDELEIEVEDNATSEQIEEEAERAAKEWMWNFVEFGMEIITDKTEQDD